MRTGQWYCRPWLLAVFFAVCFLGFSTQARAAFIGPIAEGVWSVPSGDSGNWIDCAPGTAEPNNATCVVGSYDYGADPPFSADQWCGGTCWAWPAADGPMPPLPDNAVGSCDPDSQFCAEDAVTLSWMVIGCWAAAWTLRLLVMAARPG